MTDMRINVYAGTYAAENPLADRLRMRFESRGVYSVRQSAVLDNVRRAQSMAAMKVRPAAQSSGEGYRRMLEDAQRIRERNRYIAQCRSAEQRRPRQNAAVPTTQPAQGAMRKSAPGTARKPAPKQRTAEIYRDKRLTKDGEVKMPRTKLPIAAIALTLICTMMMMFIIYSYTLIYQKSSSIGDLEDEISSLEAQKEDLMLALERKNDIRTIEKIATEEIGMVNTELVERRFVSLSTQDRIEILNTETDENANKSGGAVSTLLSILYKPIGGLLDYVG